MVDFILGFLLAIVLLFLIFYNDSEIVVVTDQNEEYCFIRSNIPLKALSKRKHLFLKVVSIDEKSHK